MPTYSFKSSGKTQEQLLTEQLAAAKLPVGIKTPLRLGKDEGIFEMNYNLPDQVHDNLRNLLQTNWGERLGLYAFGANLRELTTEYTNQDDFDKRAMGRISDAIKQWMPYVELETYTATYNKTDNVNTAIIQIIIAYNVPSLSVTHRALEVDLYVVG
jgi:phage baseplate assembly protein W